MEETHQYGCLGQFIHTLLSDYQIITDDFFVFEHEEGR
jgi:hypothetical protein